MLGQRHGKSRTKLIGLRDVAHSEGTVTFCRAKRSDLIEACAASPSHCVKGLSGDEKAWLLLTTRLYLFFK